jgi:hypothetical protein
MQATCQTAYKSEFGWSMQLCGKWKRLTRRNPEDRTPFAIFSTPEDWSLSLSWMIDRATADDETLTAFDTATMIAGALSVEETETVVSKIFPNTGEILRGNVIVLADGKKALEVVAVLRAQDSQMEDKISYSLILPRRKRGEYRNHVHFQKLSFISNRKTFHERYPEVSKIARSFQYATMVR